MAKEWDISGIRAGPWKEVARTPHRQALDPLPFGDQFIASAWAFKAKVDLEPRFFWRAGRRHGSAQDLEEGKTLADASLREQGVVGADVLV